MRVPGINSLFAFAFFVFVFTFSTSAATLTVTKTADTNDGVCDADCSLREAIKKANDLGTSDVIMFDASVFATPQVITLILGEISIINFGALEIKGPGANMLTVDGNLQSRIFSIGMSTPLDRGITIRDLTLSRGKINATGGCIYQGSGILTLESLWIKDCEAGGGGAIYDSGGSLIINNSTISNNSAGGGGGISGGGTNSILNITNSSIVGNTATTDQGGGIRNGFDTATLTNVTVAFNSAASEGGGIYNFFNGTITNLRNSIVANNSTAGTGPDFGGTLTSQGFNLVKNTSGATIVGNTAGNIIGQDPLLGPFQHNGGQMDTRALLSGSPAIDTGDPNNILQFDQRGAIRALDGDANGTYIPDIGAVEAGARMVTKVEDTADGICDADCSLREAILAANNIAGNRAILFSSLFNVPQIIVLNGTALDIYRQGALSIRGPGAALLTVSGNSQSNAFHTGGPSSIDGATIVFLSDLKITQSQGAVGNGVTMTLNRLHITGNSVASSGPAINNQPNATLTVNDCLITNNSATSNNSGTIVNNDALMTLNNTVIANNNVTKYGGGVFNFHGALNIVGSVIRGNTANDSGGGIRNTVGDLTIIDSTISNNASGADGGGIESSFNGFGSMVIVGSTISGNSAGNNGGGIYNNAPLEITNSTVAGNTGDSGGGIFVNSSEGTLNVTNSAVVFNTAQTGGGIRATGPVTSRNTVIANNSASSSGPDFLGTLTSLGSNLVKATAGTVITGNTTGNILGQDPMIDPVLRDYGGKTLTYAMKVNSPLLDKGDNCVLNSVGNGGCLSTAIVVDQRGVSRPQEGDRNSPSVVDIGAFEASSQEVTTAPSAPDLQAAFDSGISNTDNITKLQSLTFTVGSTDTSAIIECYRNGVLIATFNSTGFSAPFSDNTLPANGSFGYACRKTRGGSTSLIGPELSVMIDNTSPSVSVNQASDQPDPTRFIPLKYSVSSNEQIAGLDVSDFQFGGTINTATAVLELTGSDATRSFTVDQVVSNGGVLTATLNAGSFTDVAGNPNLAAVNTDNQITLDNVAPTVSVNQASGQADPTSNQPINFAVVFSENVIGFNPADISVQGSTANVSAAQIGVTGSGSNYNVAVSGISSPGQVIATVIAGTVQDLIGNTSVASTSIDNNIQFVFSKPLFDYDGDGKSDISVWRPSDGTWNIIQSGNASVRAQGWGLDGDKLAPADFDGDGKTDLSVFRESDSNWYIFNSSTNTASVAGWGLAGDLPVPADYGGDGKADLAVYRPSEGKWYRRDSDGKLHIYEWGLPGDKPAPADFNGDGVADMTVFRPSEGRWYTLNSGNAAISEFTWGLDGDLPIPGDYSGDGKSDFAVFRPSNQTWYRIHSDTFQIHIITWGLPGDLPTPGDYDGDGRQDLAVFRPSNSTWFINSSTGGIYSQPFGLSGDIPVENAFVRIE